MISERSIESLKEELADEVKSGSLVRFDGVVMNAGILEYPGRINEM